MALLKRGNANYVRGAHYPHDPRMLDRLDEAGIVFWSETIGPDVKLTNTEDWEYFMPVQLVQLQEVRSGMEWLLLSLFFPLPTTPRKNIATANLTM